MKRPWVIKAGGELLATPPTAAKFSEHSRRIQTRRAVVFVHGGGPQIEAELKRNNVRRASWAAAASRRRKPWFMSSAF